MGIVYIPLFVYSFGIKRMIRKQLLAILLIIVFAVPIYANEEEETERSLLAELILVAAYTGNEQLLREILVSGVDRDVRDPLGHTALHLAMYQNNLTVVRLLLDHGFDLNARGARSGHTPLHIAVTADNEAAARLLVQYGANRNIKGTDGLTALDIARRGGKQRLASLLVNGR